jgi:hypothetical protein
MTSRSDKKPQYRPQNGRHCEEPKWLRTGEYPEQIAASKQHPIKQTGILAEQAVFALEKDFE